MDRPSRGTINEGIGELNKLDLTDIHIEHYRKQEKNIYYPQVHTQHFPGQTTC